MMAEAADEPLSPGTLRRLATLLFLLISAALVVGFTFDTYFATDGAFYFTIILDHARFTEIAPARSHAEYLSQWPLVLGVRAGLTDLTVLEWLFGLGLWFPWALGFVISLYATRERPALLFFYVISLACLNLSAWSVFIGEHLVLLSVAWPILFLAILRRPLNLFEQVLTGTLLVAHLRLYESAVATGSLFALIFAFRIWLAGTARERWVSVGFLLLALASVVIALNWILFPRDAGNRTSFLGAMLASLLHPYPWMGVGFVVLMAVGKILRNRIACKASWIVPLTIGVLSLPSPGILAGIAFSTRTLSLTALPLLMGVAILFSLSKMRVTKRLANLTSLVVLAICLLHVRHLQSWIQFQDRFVTVLRSERGFVDPADHPDLVHWGWTNSLLSYVWSEGDVRAIILNPDEDGYQPFDPHSEVVLEKYLRAWPEMVERKAE
jgi:hypothetical protein